MSSTREEDAALLGALFESRGSRLSRGELAGAAGLNPSMLDQRLAPFIEAGYPIEFHPQGDICFGEPPDIWSAEEIAGRCPALSASSLRWDPLLLAETGSTNDVARRGARAGFLAAAARQTRGRGRLGRNWESPSGCGLYVSLLLRPAWSAAEAGRLTILCSVAAVDAVEAVAGFRPQIKWPNDLLAGGRKLGGLLIETEREGGRLAFAVAGLGLNVRQTADDFSPEVRGLATSLFLQTGQLYRRADLLVALLRAVDRRLEEPFARVRLAWEGSSLTLGQQVTLATAQGQRQGQAVGLDESGALLLRNGAGEVETVTAGDMQAV
jgi:BirA family biotin operon repressor/biotin-[acetyl-CoA-carboxylase] ligase